MTRQRTAGFEQARQDGLLDGSPDIRVGLGMSGFSATAAAEHVDDVTLDEYDGAGYTRYDATGVAIAYDSGSDQWRITCDNGDGDEFGTTVAVGGEPSPSVLFVILRIDGNPANDWFLGWSDEGTLNGPNGGTYGLTLPNDVILFSGNAT